MGDRVITVRNVPENLYKALQSLAKRNRRSMQQQALVLLERAYRLQDGDAPLERARELRARVHYAQRGEADSSPSPRKARLGDTVQEIREERER